MASAHPDVRHFSLSLCTPLVTFRLLPWCWSSQRVSPIRAGESVGSLGGTAWGSRSFFHQLNSHWFLQPEVVGIYLHGTETLDWESWYGAGNPHSQDISPEFLSTTCGCGTSPIHDCTTLTNLDWCGFFNSVVVRLPFNLIFDCSEWRFYILVVISMWLYKEASHVCLRCHLYRQSSLFCLYIQNRRLVDHT